MYCARTIWPSTSIPNTSFQLGLLIAVTHWYSFQKFSNCLLVLLNITNRRENNKNTVRFSIRNKSDQATNNCPVEKCYSNPNGCLRLRKWFYTSFHIRCNKWIRSYRWFHWCSIASVSWHLEYFPVGAFAPNLANTFPLQLTRFHCLDHPILHPHFHWICL